MRNRVVPDITAVLFHYHKLGWSQAGECAEEAVRVIERDARSRALQALFDPLPSVRERYLFDPTFHAAIDAVVALIVAGVMGHPPITDSEREERVKAFETIMPPLTQAALEELKKT